MTAPQPFPLPRCTRCGACLSICPVYGETGNERFSPRGKIHLIKDFLRDERRNHEGVRETISACLQCGACSTVCSTGVDPAGLIRKMRGETGSHLPWWIQKVLAKREFIPFLARIPFSRGIFSRLIGNPALSTLVPLFKQRPAIRRLGGGRAPLRIGVNKGPRVAFFIGCIQNFLYPEVAEAIVRWFNGEVIAPAGQTCCGLAAWASGDDNLAKKLALENINAFRKFDADFIVTGCASCASMLKDVYPGLVGDEEGGRQPYAKEFSGRIREFSELVIELGINPPATRATGRRAASFHAPCHQRFKRGGVRTSEQVMKSINGVDYLRMDPGCCGQGGLFGTRHPAISSGIWEKRIAAWERTGAGTVVTTCSGCLLQWRTRMEGRRDGPEILHLAELALMETGRKPRGDIET